MNAYNMVVIDKYKIYIGVIICVYQIYHIGLFCLLISQPLHEFMYICLLVFRFLSFCFSLLFFTLKVKKTDCSIYQSLCIGVCTLVSIICYTQGTIGITSFKVSLHSIQLFLSLLITCCIVPPEKKNIQPCVTLVEINIVDSTEESCSICTEPFKIHSTVKTPCGHLFHNRCIQRWITESSNMSCPMCRENLYNKSQN